MTHVAQWGLIGYRNGEYPNIGGEVARQLAQPDVARGLGLAPEPTFIVTSKGIFGPDARTPLGCKSLADITPFPDVTFVALPSTNDGAVAYEYISQILARGNNVVTAEKGAVVNNFDALRDLSDGFSRLGITATVGGGTRMIDIAKTYCADTKNVSQIHLMLNGTLTDIMSQVGPRGNASGVSLGQAVERAVRLGYAEPGSHSPFDVLKSETEGDIPKKTAIFFNAVGLGPVLLDWQKLRFQLTDDQLAQVMNEAKTRRFIVSLYADRFHGNDAYVGQDIVGGFSVQHAGWRIFGGFQHVERNPLLSDLARLTGPGNGAVFGLGPNEKDGVYIVTGPGAGVSPTVNTMLDDYNRLRTL